MEVGSYGDQDQDQSSRIIDKHDDKTEKEDESSFDCH